MNAVPKAIRRLGVWAIGTLLLLLAPAIPTTVLGQKDSGKIAFYSNRSGRDDIYMMNADGSDVQVVTKGQYGGKCPDLSPDGSQMVFVSMRDGNSEIYLMDLESGVERRLTSLSSTERQPKWSPDGKHIAFQSNRDGNYEIHTMEADGTGWRRLTHSDAEELWPKWSPDGRQIVFNSFRDDNWEIYVVNSNGTNLQRVTNTPEIWETGGAWSPDGKYLVFRSGQPRQFQGNIHRINVDGTNEIELTDFDGVEENPIWSPDGRHILFQSMMDGNFDLYIMDADGTNLKNLTANSSHDWWPTWVAPRALDEEQNTDERLLDASDVEIRIAYDDAAAVDGMTPGRGFSCLIRVADKTLIFDAGAIGQLLMANLETMVWDPEEVDRIAISHCHSDHIGGLPSVLAHCGGKATVYLPGKELPKTIIGRALEIIPAKIDSAENMTDCVVYIEGPQPICRGIMTTGPLDQITPEQSLIILTDAGAVLITGCAHYGIHGIVEKASELVDMPILLVMGGFHLGLESEESLDELAVQLDGLTEFIAPCHCSGELAHERFRRRFGDRCLDIGTGSVITISDLAREELDSMEAETAATGE